MNLEPCSCRVFITENQYCGDWDGCKNCMEGFGMYTFRDGTTYSGYFKNGLAHGCGRWHFPEPHSFTVIGTSEYGKLRRILDFLFVDGLRMEVHKCRKFNLKNWDYCRKNNRVFADELSRGLQAVGDVPYTPQQPSSLNPGQYSIGNEIYFEKSGFVKKNDESGTTKFIPCIQTQNWLKENSPSGEGLLPNETIARKIFNTNIENEHSEQVNACLCPINGRQYFERLCRRESVDSEIISVTSNINTIKKSLSSSSFASDSSINPR